MATRVLTIDDDPAATQGLKKLLEKRGYTVKEENDSTRALETARKFQPDVVVLDFLMPRAHGGDVAWQLASDPVLRRAKVIMCSGVPLGDFAAKLPPSKIPVLEKPVNSEDLLRLIGSSEN